jgi:exopolyphosphatase / guanosine-5'-triphosphate,3'-diphosphate pyrophosphatase
VFTDGRINPGAAAAAADGLAQVSLRMNDLAITRYRAVATSAVRESTNRREFLRRIRDRVGMRLEIISGSEEIRLVHAAVRRRVALGADPWVLVELGGGSVEIALADGEKVRWSETHAMGAVRLMQLFAHAGKESAGFTRLVQEYVATIRIPEKLKAGAKGLIGTGGNIDALARLRAGTAGGQGPLRISRADLRQTIEELSRLSVEERMRRFGLRPDRADVIVPAAIVYEHLAGLVGAEEIIVPGGGVREGIVFDLMERLTHRQDSREKQAVEDAVQLGRKFLFDEIHARHVAYLAVSLFDQLSDVHALGASERRFLATAAILHDVGGFVSYKGHHKHSQYLISRSELPGFTPREMLIVGTIARYHRKGAPSSLHPEFALLSPAQRARVRKLSALLRIADALDKEHRQKITRIQVSAEDGQVRIRAEDADEVLLEQWALDKKDEVFREVFGMSVTLTTGKEEADG